MPKDRFELIELQPTDQRHLVRLLNLKVAPGQRLVTMYHVRSMPTYQDWEVIVENPKPEATA